MAVADLDQLRFWLAERSGLLGLVLAICIAILLTVIVVPLGPSTAEQGTIVNFGLNETDTGSYPLAVVDLPEGRVTVRLSRINDCTVGGRIHVLNQRRLWGPYYVASTAPCV